MIRSFAYRYGSPENLSSSIRPGSLALCALTFSSLAFASSGLAATLPPLGSAVDFAVLGASTVTNTGPSVVTGDLGVSPGSALTGFPPGIVTGAKFSGVNSKAGPAQADALIAYNDAAGQVCRTNLTGVDLGGKILTPGVYCFDSSAQLTGTLTLDFQNDADAVFIFQTGSSLTTASNSSVVTSNGAPPCHGVIWQIGSSATLGTGTEFLGDILALASITVTTAASSGGGLYALTGAVTLDSNVIEPCGGPPSACSSDLDCADDDPCVDAICDPEDPDANLSGCRYDFVCQDICRSPVFYGKRAGSERGDENLTQSVIDAAGGLVICGQAITETSNAQNPWLDGLGLDSALEGLCVRSDGTPERSLYRELIATALNCTMSGSEHCDAVVRREVNVSFSACNALCTDNALAEGSNVPSSMERDCIRQLACYNSGGRMVGDKCAVGSCDVTGEPCGREYGVCPPIAVITFPILQVCERFPGNCRDADFCQPGIDICPSGLPVTSGRSCKEAARNICTIDSCD